MSWSVMKSGTFLIGDLERFSVTERSSPPARRVHLILYTAVHHTKLQLQHTHTALKQKKEKCRLKEVVWSISPSSPLQTRYTRPRRDIWRNTVTLSVLPLQNVWNESERWSIVICLLCFRRFWDSNLTRGDELTRVRSWWCRPQGRWSRWDFQTECTADRQPPTPHQ